MPALLTLALELQIKGIGIFGCRKLAVVVVVGALDDLLERSQVHSQRHIAVTSELAKRVCLEPQRDESDVRVVHCL